MNCSARIVLPLPGRPMIMLSAFLGSPPPRTASKSPFPLGKRSLISRAAGLAVAEEVLHGRHELQGLNRLLEKGVRASRERLLAKIQARDAQQRSPAPA